ncbi:MAG: terminase small subunit [Cetobacterium sp.]
MAEKKGNILTTKQETFVRELVSGKSQRQAYKVAYGCETWKDASIDRKACEMFANVKIKARYDELIAECNKKTLWTRERAINELVEMLRDSKDDKNYQARYNSIRELNTIVGLYPKETKEVELNINKPDKDNLKNLISKVKGVKK